jgi:putative endonuclease
VFTVYILQSEKFSKTYVGFTSNLEERMKSHNGLATKGWTVKFRPWKILYKEEYASKQEAMQREKWFKSGVGRAFIKQKIRQ